MKEPYSGIGRQVHLWGCLSSKRPSVFLLLLEWLGIHSSGLKSKSTGWTVSQAEASVRFTLQVLTVGETGLSFSNAWICTLTGGSVPRSWSPLILAVGPSLVVGQHVPLRYLPKMAHLGAGILLAAPCSAQLSHKEILQDILLQERTCPITSLGTGTGHVTANPPVASLRPLCYSCGIKIGDVESKTRWMSSVIRVVCDSPVENDDLLFSWC